MTDLHFDYDQLVQGALKTVIAGVLKHVSEHGLPGDHHFYITFDTSAEGVLIPPYLRERYPEDMTIVLQHHFRELKVSESHFEVQLRFNGKPELLSIPFDAVIAFVDPGAQFALQFQSDLYPEEEGEGDPELPFVESLASSASGVISASEPDEEPDAEIAASDNIVTLDAFRKKG